MERRLECQQRFEGGVGAGAFVHLENHLSTLGLAAIRSSKAHWHGHEFVVELAGFDGRDGLFVAIHRELVGLLARDVEARGETLRSKSHREIGVGIVLHQPGVGGDFVAAHGNHGHGLDATGNHDLGSASHNALGTLGDRLQSGRAEAVDGDGRGLDRKSGAQGGDAGNVHALFRFRHGATQDDVLDLFGVELGHALEGTLDRIGSEVVGTGGAQGSLVGFADRGSNGTDDYDFTHEELRAISN